MNLKQSWVNVPLLKNIIKQNTLPAKISLIAVCSFSVIGLFSISGGAQAIALMAFGISAVGLTTCYAGFIQKYMTVKNEANFVASLPISSVTLWLTHYLAGLLLVIVTLTIEALFIVFFSFRAGIFGYSSTYICLPIATLLLAIIYYTISYFVSCMAGNRLGQFLYTVIAYALPVLLYIAVLVTSNMLVPGGIHLDDASILYLPLPLASGLEFALGNQGNWPYFLGQVLITLVFFVGSYFVYKNRSIENTGDTLLYKGIHQILKVLVVLAVTLTLYIVTIALVGIISDYQTSTIFIAGFVFVVLGALIALFIEIILKGNHIYKSLLYYLPILAFCFVSCYLYGQYLYQKNIQHIGESEQTMVTIYNVDKGPENYYGQLELSGKEAKKMLTTLHKKQCINQTIFDEESAYVQVDFVVTNTKGVSSYLEFKLPKKEYLTFMDTNKEIVKNNIKEIFSQDSNVLKMTEDDYLFVSNSWNEEESDGYEWWYATTILDAKQIEQLANALDNEAYYTIDSIYGNTFQAINKDSKLYLHDGQDEIQTLLEEPQAIERANRLNQCLTIMDYTDESFSQITASYPVLNKETILSKVFKVPDGIVFFSEEKIILKVIYHVEDQNELEYGYKEYPMTATFIWQNDRMVLESVQEGGE